MWKTIGLIFKESLQDSATGKYSSTRIISMLVAIAATVFMWKLVIMGGMSTEYFLAYLAYGTGNASLNKFLDNKDSARSEQATALLQTEYSQTPQDYNQQPQDYYQQNSPDTREPQLQSGKRPAVPRSPKPPRPPVAP